MSPVIAIPHSSLCAVYRDGDPYRSAGGIEGLLWYSPYLARVTGAERPHQQTLNPLTLPGDDLFQALP